MIVISSTNSMMVMGKEGIHRGYTGVQSEGEGCVFANPDFLGVVYLQIQGPSANDQAQTQVLEFGH